MQTWVQNEACSKATGCTHGRPWEGHFPFCSFPDTSDAPRPGHAFPGAPFCRPRNWGRECAQPAWCIMGNDPSPGTDSASLPCPHFRWGLRRGLRQVLRPQGAAHLPCESQVGGRRIRASGRISSIPIQRKKSNSQSRLQLGCAHRQPLKKCRLWHRPATVLYA